MKKFRILMGALALAMVAATVTGCKKEKELDAKNNSTYSMKTYSIYYNGKLVESFSEKEYVPVRSADMELTSIVDTNSIYYFDQDAQFRQFCTERQMEIIYENNLKLNLIHQKAVELGLSDADEDVVPQAMADYWQSVFGAELSTMMEPNRAIFIKLYDGLAWDGTSRTFCWALRPTLGNMDNKTSSLSQYIGFGANVMCYNKWFGGKKRWYWLVGSQVDWTLAAPNLQQDDNQYSSYVCFLL